MNKSFYIGSYKDDALNEAEAHRGWLVGALMDDIPRKNDAVGIKYWEFEKGDNQGHPMKVSTVIECTFILKGMTKCIIDGDSVILKAGDYIVIQPGTPNNTVSEILEDAAGITVKSPSDPSAKTVIQ